ncbi:MAG: thioredoxin domain-containing protein [Marinilabiliaceae bacterium]|nr:thioredoxin domain-containing protein [Marinilabiliaceae bacterium]
MDIVIGNTNASINIYFFGNYKCSFCTTFLKEDLPKILNQWNDKVKFTIKLIPYSNTKQESDALKMAIAVNKYGNYQPYHEVLLKDANIIFSNDFQDYLFEIMKYNEAIATFFNKDSLIENYLNENQKLLKKMGIKGTPTYIIGNKIIKGYISHNELTEIINNDIKQ